MACVSSCWHLGAARWKEFEKKNVTDLGILVDYCALWQAPRTAEQDEAFKEGLKGINQARAWPSMPAPHSCAPS